MNPALNVDQARFNMVEQQIRPWDVLDQSVLELLFVVKREDFVPAAYRSLAFADIEIPIGHDQFMMNPKVEARIVQDLGIQPTDRVLEIGTGSGYLTALLARRAGRVVSVEMFADLSASARAKLDAAGVHNVELKVGDAAQGQRDVIGSEPFDVIVLTGSTPVLPIALTDALKPGGRMFAVTGDAPVMHAGIVTRNAGNQIQRTEVFETVLQPLINAAQPARFEF
jgi:protein-L-isoaspartate(D-aspartate) O-methyltransferase